MTRLSLIIRKVRQHTYAAFLIVTAVVFCVSTSPLHAITQQDIHSIITESPWYNPNDVTCSAPGSGPANLTVGKNFSLGPAGEENGKQRRTNLIKALMAAFNITAEQGAGVVGNFMAESGGQWLPPDVNEGKGAGPPAFKGGYGWAQWTGGRQVTFIDYVTKPEQGFMASKADHATDAANYAYLLHELTTSQKSTITELKIWSSPEDSAVSFEHTFERAGKPVLEKRKAYARQAFNEYLEGGSGATGGGTTGGAGSCGATGGDAGIVGQYAFPLSGSKKVVNNPGMFRDGTASRGGHPYIAFDILANPGVPVVAFLSGTITSVTADKCPGRMFSVYNKESNLTVSYLHMNFGPNDSDMLGKTVTLAQQLGTVGAAPNGCGTPHLHIDAAVGMNRPGCKREDCPAANAAKFRDIGPQLFETFQALKDN
jgi:hypothetical protein